MLFFFFLPRGQLCDITAVRQQVFSQEITVLLWQRRFQPPVCTKFSHLPFPARTVFKLPGNVIDNRFVNGRLKESPVVKK